MNVPYFSALFELVELDEPSPTPGGLDQPSPAPAPAQSEPEPAPSGRMSERINNTSYKENIFSAYRTLAVT